MQGIVSFSDTDYDFIVVITLTTIAYCSYYFIAFSEKAFLWIAKRLKFKNNPVAKFCFQKLSGFIFLGLLPALFIIIFLNKSPFQYGFMGKIGIETVYWILVTSLIIIPINFFIAGKPENLKQYPQIRINNWSKSTFLVDGAGWFMYLLAYEYLFRGVLLVGVYPTLGMMNAIVIGTSIYALAHIHKGSKETFGSIPVGLLVCFITFETGSIWASFFIHLVMALSNEFFAFYRNPKMLYNSKPVKIIS